MLNPQKPIHLLGGIPVWILLVVHQNIIRLPNAPYRRLAAR